MKTRRQEPSGMEARASANEKLGWDNASRTLINALGQLQEYHDIRCGGVESILQFINEMLDKWELLIPDLKVIFDYSKYPENDPWKDPSHSSS
jgi:hypothetical protein